jgi:hypothetical protein
MLRRLTHVSSALLLLALTPWAAAEGIVAYRNDTRQPLVVQSAAKVNGSVKLSKPQTLFPGERAVDSLVVSGLRRIVIYDARRPNIVLLQVDVANQEDTFYSIVPRSRAIGRGEPPNTPTIELVKIPPPITLPKTGSPQPPKKR